MDVSLTFTDFQSALDEFRQQTGADRHFYDCETYLTLPKTLGQGNVRSIQLRDGLELFLQDCQLHRSLSLKCLDTDLANSWIALKFCVSGFVSGSMRGSSTHLCSLAGEYALSYCPGNAGSIELPTGKQIRTVELAIAPSIFRDTIDEADFPPELRRILDANVPIPYWQFSKTTSLMAIALGQILHCPYQGKTRRLYLESKGLELIALYWKQLKVDRSELQKTHQLKPDDVKRIHQAKDLLIHQLDNPPSLLSLARQVGINDCKLKQGFRQVFGTTVFGYLHNYRMEQAAQLLQENHMTIAGVAHAVGFAHRGSFAAAFRRKFGVNPKDYLAAYQKQYWIVGQKSPSGDHKTSG
ncbi:helix-turn-helix transcriptional regulator [Chroogloeocystis siderophila]|uniref:HTH araC/xylS-type domain-containing protein n=1 Tax=Chroogloeocystis siderophila 5.2 s.c.1 TaxID=247279 RepID=A0A1U7HY37_9CHRO|nr:AraC family transcriptional regulator [Chroogloeocystis siderophila]OKH28510.1 hypothetical protein NIES1031_04560 [Chroogloeocystis siderophila 5.2 s.c.1]